MHKFGILWEFFYVIENEGGSRETLCIGFHVEFYKTKLKPIKIEFVEYCLTLFIVIGFQDIMFLKYYF